MSPKRIVRFKSILLEIDLTSVFLDEVNCFNPLLNEW
jgi:hypothetical protein